MTDQAPQESFAHRILARIFNPLWVLPALIVLGLFVAESVPDAIDSFYTETGAPFLITCWIGLGFTEVWRRLRDSTHLEGTSPGIIAGTGILSAIILMSMLGGIRLLWEDPRLFGVAVAPGFSMARPLLERWILRHPAQPIPDKDAGAGPPMS